MAWRVVIGYDGSEAAEDAVAFGLTWCRSTGDVPVVATVYPEEHPLGAGRVDAEWAAYVRELGQETLDKAQVAAGDAAIYRLVASTSAARGLADLAEDVDAAAVLVGGSRKDEGGRRRIGSVANRLLYGATVPVCVVPEAWQAPDRDLISKIGVAFVDTKDGHEALRAAVRAASRIPARLVLYSVVARSTEHYSFIAGRRDEQVFYDAARASYTQALDYAVAGVPTQLEPQAVLLEGDVAERLAQLGLDDLDMLVCGSRGYGPIRRVLLGGVSARLVRRSQLPVMVVPRASAGSSATQD
jgi:nucleotide-binding universal stress UspA family protein